MPKQKKKEMRKLKDRLIHCANDMRAMMEEKDFSDYEKREIDRSRNRVIEAVNIIVEATNIPA